MSGQACAIARHLLKTSHLIYFGLSHDGGRAGLSYVIIRHCSSSLSQHFQVLARVLLCTPSQIVAPTQNNTIPPIPKTITLRHPAAKSVPVD